MKNSDSDFCTGHRHILYMSLMVKKSLSRFYSYPYFTGALMIRFGRDVLTLSGGFSGFYFMEVSGFGFGGLAVTLVSGISTGTDAPSSLLSEEPFAVG